MSRSWALVAVAALLVQAMPVGAQTVAVLQGLAVADPDTLTAGTGGRIALTLTNVGNASITRIDARVSDTDAGIVSSGDANLGGLQARGSMTVSPFAFHIPADTPPGIYTVRVAVNYIYSTGTGTGANTLTLSAPVRVASPANLFVEQVDPDRLVAGSQAATFRLANHGTGAFSNILGTWTSEDDAILPHGRGNTFFVRSLGAGNATDIPVTLAVRPDTQPGLYALQFTLDYRDAGGLNLQTVSTVGVQVTGGGAQVEVTVQDAGSGTVTLAATNVGSTPVTAVQMHLVPVAGARVVGRDTVVLGNLEPGAFMTASFDVDSFDVEMVIIAYTDSAGTRTRSTQNLLGVSSGGIGDLVASVQDMESDLVTIAVTNTGLTAVTGVQATLVPTSGVRVTNVATQAIGTLEPGGFAVAQFDVAQTEGPFEAQVMLAYTDADGSRKSTAQAVGRDVSAGPVASPFVGVGVAVVLLAGVGGAYWLVRRRKAQKEAEAAQADDTWARLEQEPGWEPPE